MEAGKPSRTPQRLVTEVTVGRCVNLQYKSREVDVKKQVQVAKEEVTNEVQEKSDNANKEKIISMAKTFEKMSIKQISPILRNLDDKTVLMIYTNTGNRFKKNILLAVNEKRAALITKEFINN